MGGAGRLELALLRSGRETVSCSPVLRCRDALHSNRIGSRSIRRNLISQRYVAEFEDQRTRSVSSALRPLPTTEPARGDTPSLSALLRERLDREFSIGRRS
ncbi:hypothetical protein MPTK1_7g10420 [Marchantia polymorpha subsp. ruderalis]|uniref:Uncharacterized protein n=2 Tax=Marchantia polymorpha TaxID=3197 RepID=A0AAF6BY34_MARPO|nr:hypothetical protein MARPO_0003s0061 [Marchantia polymorpha]BBN16918.1 hypothetical protein Mp_7g10420 [Marchantia polymorpha subsp. ruderalis]|eukprot:PTQ49159.1 hypothetical protein MARPO_0003s0061 [Marchantia polymorpha]